MTDAWPAYGFLSEPNSNYIHHVYNHSRCNFGAGYGSTSRIESFWNELKARMKKIYATIKSKIFIYFLREIENRRSINNFSSFEKLNNFATLISCVGIRDKKDYLNEEELLFLDYDTNI